MEKRNFGSSICVQAAPNAFSSDSVPAMSSLQLRVPELDRQDVVGEVA